MARVHQGAVRTVGLALLLWGIWRIRAQTRQAFAASGVVRPARRRPNTAPTGLEALNAAAPPTPEHRP